MVRFDAYTATTSGVKTQEILGILAESATPGTFAKIRQGKGFHTFGERIAISDESGAEWGAVQWGGRQGDRLMIEVKGEATPGAVEAIRARFPHRCTRVDACADFDEPGAFDRLLSACQSVKQGHRLRGEKSGDWEDFPELGRTLYLGSRASTCRVRLYEKGKQPEYIHLNRPDWARIEVQVRPSKDAKAQFSRLSPTEVWGASKWTRELAGHVLKEHIDPHPAGTTYRRTHRDLAIEWMCKQYGPHLVSLAGDLGGWPELGLTLRDICAKRT